MNIQKEDFRLHKLQKVEQDMKANPDSKLYVWGCAATASMITDFCEKNSSISVAAYIVDDLYYEKDSFHGRKIYKASEWRKCARSGDFVIMGFTGSKRGEKVIGELPAGVTGIYFHFPYSANANGTYLNYNDYIQNKEAFCRAYDRLEDDFSKKTMEAFINGCITGDVEELEKLQWDGQYFNELTKECQVGCFVDCGAYVGDTIEKAVEFYQNKLQKIVAFEPDMQNIRLLKEKVLECGVTEEKLQLITKGTWSKEDVLHFSSSNSSSSISEEGDIEIEVDSIDHALEKVSESIDFIKMDVEGSEKESLLGAANTIKKYHPLLAVCVYHKEEDLYELTRIIDELSGENPYRFYLKYHGPDLRELVLYAIP